MLAKALARRPDRRQGSVIAIVLVAIGAITLGVLAQAGPAAGPSASPGATAAANAATASASARSSEPASAEPSSPNGAWAPVELAPLTAIATLQPSSADDAGIPSDATFTLGSLSVEPARAVSARLEVTPAIAFTVGDTADPAAATIRPTGPLEAGRTYRFLLRNPDQTIAGSWAFRVRGPVAVIGTIPGNATIDVPLRTGIEVTFDQDGVADMAGHFSIDPAVKGTFERHGRTQVFVPSSLAAATTYTVTIRKGLARTGTDLSLPADVVSRFETEGRPDEQPRLVFAREAIEAGPGQPLTIAVEAIRPWVSGRQAPAPTSARVRIYRLPTLEAANRALTDLLGAPHWTQYAEPLISTRGLRTVASFTGPLEPLSRDILSVRVPVTLDPGWYVLEIPGTRRSQAFLQITPVSAWVSVLTDRTVVWVNDVTTHRAIARATVAVGAGKPFARSDVDGLAVAATPTALIPPAAGGDPTAGSPVLRVTSPDGQVVLVPFNVRGDTQAYRGEWWEMYGSTDETYWSLLYTDREMYRRTDRIELWGYLRGRDEGTIPARVELRLVTSAQGSDAEATTLATTEVRPGQDGSFLASLPVSDLPLDSYVVQAVVDKRVVVSRWVAVTIIGKPAYRLELASEPTAVITGTPVTVTASATFFDGTPVARLPIVLTGDENVPESRLTTDAAGHATMTLDTPTSSTAWSDWRWLLVRPAGLESADISAGTSILIFPSAYNIDGTGTLNGRRLTFAGKLTKVDLARVRRALAAGTWDGDAAGRAMVGATVRATITELVPVRHQVGVEYDFVDKVVRPIYEYDYTYKVVRSVSVRSGQDGAIRFSLSVPSAEHDYQIRLSTRDGQGRLQEETVWANPAESATPEPGVQFVTDDGRPVIEAKFGVGDRISWRMVDRGRDLPSNAGDRYLYVIAQRGLRAAVVTDTPRFRRTFAATDAPGIFVMGIRFTGTTYAPKAASWADFDSATRSINVEVQADRPAYRPGETARLSVTTTGPDGEPVAATVVLQAVDQKLYAMGGASTPRPLDDLYGRVDSGIVRLTATHQVPSMSGPEGEGGDTTGGGGGERSDFRDTLLFRELRTDATGRAATTVDLSDDLTSWHVTAAAVTADLSAGVGELLLPVGLPFFVEPTLADTYLVSDRPVIQVRAFGDSLRAGDPVEFSVSSPSLGLAVRTVRGTAFEPVDVPLPALSPGTQSITVRGVAPTRTDAAGRAQSDGLTRTFEVVTSRLTAGATGYGLLSDGLPTMPAGAERATWTFTDAGRGRLLTLLSGLAESPGVRLDAAIAQANARRALVDTFGRDPASFSPPDVDLSIYPIGNQDESGETVVRGGVGLVPYGSLDPWLAARVALLAPDALPASPLREALESIKEGSSTMRDLQIAAIAGLAGLGEPVLEDLLGAARQPDLTPTERLYLALGFEAVGDDASALAQERALLADSGERLGTWVRLRVARTSDNADATTLLAVVAAAVGDPVATDLADYASSRPATDTLNALELEAYAERALDRTPPTAASFAYTVAGRRSVVQLEAGEAFTLQLTSAQAASLSVESMTGRVGVILDARVPIAPASLQRHPDLTLTRGDLPQPIPADGVLEVNLTATFGEGAVDGCYEVADLVPSGLAPLAIGRGSTDETGITWPISVVGQEVRFCAFNAPATGRTARLRYEARVVNAGSFTWEPAVLQYPGAPELQASTPAWTTRIGSP